MAKLLPGFWYPPSNAVSEPTKAARSAGARNSASLRALIEALKHEDPALRERAADGLSKTLGNPAFAESLKKLKEEDKLLKDLREGISIKSQISTLPTLGRGLPWLLPLPVSPSKSGPTASRSPLPDYSESPTTTLIATLHARSSTVREASAKELGTRDDLPAEAVSALINTARNDPVASVRAKCVGALAMLSEHLDSVLPVLEAALTDPDAGVRQEAVDALTSTLMMMNSRSRVNSGYWTDAILRALTRTLGDEDPDVRRMSIRGIGSIAEQAKAYAPEVAKKLEDTDNDVQFAALVNLKKMKPEPAVVIPGLAKMLRATRPSLRKEAAKYLGSLSASAAPSVPALIDTLGDYKPKSEIQEPLDPDDVTPAVIEALGEIGVDAKEAVPHLVRTMQTAEQSRAARGQTPVGDRRDDEKVELAASTSISQIAAALQDARRTDSIEILQIALDALVQSTNPLVKERAKEIRRALEFLLLVRSQERSGIWKYRWAFTIAIFVMMMLVAYGFLKTNRQYVQKYVPGISLVFGIALSNWKWIEERVPVNGSLLLYLLGGTFIVMLAVGLRSPRAFRLLAKAEPFRFFAGLVLQRPFVRRRMYSDYIAELEKQIKTDRAHAYDESYVRIPAVLKTGFEVTEERISIDPAAEISGLLLAANSDERPNVLIESPGGRGKSALVRAVVEQCLARFKKDAQLPLPVICDGRGEVEQMIATALGRHILVRDALSSEIERGAFLVVIDGVKETGFGPESIRSFLRETFADATRLLLASRPDDRYREAVQCSPVWIIAEPQRLDDSTLAVFVNEYVVHDSQLGHSRSSEPSEFIKNACKSGDGTYLPILIRLAVRVGGENGDGGYGPIADLYRRAFRNLIKKPRPGLGDDDLIVKASKLCLDTYWKDGFRRFSFTDATQERKAVIKDLLDANIVVSADETRISDAEPKQVRFFHDSMQSFLTAVGLFGQYHDDENWAFLQRAAGEAAFVKAQSDLFAGGSELFQMSLQVLAPQEKLISCLRSHLLEWAKSCDNYLRKLDILRAMPDPLRGAVGETTGLESAGRLLQRVVGVVEPDSKTEILALATVYSRMAPHVWPIIEANVDLSGSTAIR